MTEQYYAMGQFIGATALDSVEFPPCCQRRLSIPGTADAASRDRHVRWGSRRTTFAHKPLITLASDISLAPPVAGPDAKATKPR
jgi:hypothetical protein